MHKQVKPLEYSVVTSKDKTQEEKIEELRLRKRLVKLIHHPNAANETKEVLKSCVGKLNIIR